MFRQDEQKPIGQLILDAANLGTPTDDEVRAYWRRRGVFLSSVIAEFETERSAAIGAIRSREARPVAWETITPRPVKAEDAWLAGVNAAHALVLVLGRSYGRVRDDSYSATHAEFRRAQERGIERWVFLDARVPRQERDGQLTRWIEDDLAPRHSYASFDSPEELAAGVAARLDDAAAFELFTWFKFGRAVLRADTHSLATPDASTWSGGWRGTLEAQGEIADPDLRAYLARAHQQRTQERLVVEGQLFDAELTGFVETGSRGRYGYQATFALSVPRADSSTLLDVTFHAQGQIWTGDDIATITTRRVLGLPASPAPEHVSMPAPVDWRALVAKAGRIPELVQVLAELVVTEQVVSRAVVSRVHLCEARLVGPPLALALRLRGSRSSARGLGEQLVEVSGEVPLV